MSSDHESVPLVPSPPGVWHAVSYVAAKTRYCRLKKRDSILLNAGGGAGNRKFPNVIEQRSCRL